MLNRIKKVSKKIFNVLHLLVMTIILKTSAYASGVSEGSINSGVSQSIDGVFLLIAVIFGALSGFNFIQAILAYTQSSSEGGSGQASGKITTHVSVGLAAAAGAALVLTVFKPAIKSMIGIGQ